MEKIRIRIRIKRKRRRRGYFKRKEIIKSRKRRI